MSQITKPTETIQLPAPSWAPAVFALGAFLMLLQRLVGDLHELLLRLEQAPRPLPKI